jgi:hypothetical protein
MASLARKPDCRSRRLGLDPSDAPTSPSSDSDSDHDATRRAEPSPRPKRTKFTMKNVRIVGIVVGARYMYMDAHGNRIPSRVLEVRQGASGSNQTATRGDIVLSRLEPAQPEPPRHAQPPQPPPLPTVPPNGRCTSRGTTYLADAIAEAAYTAYSLTLICGVTSI